MYKEYLKIYITRLKNTSVYKILLNNYFLIVLYIIFLLSTITRPVTCIIFIIYNIFLYKKSKEIIKVSLLFSFIILIIFLFIKLTIPFNNENEKTALTNSSLYSKIYSLKVNYDWYFNSSWKHL